MDAKKKPYKKFPPPGHKPISDKEKEAAPKLQLVSLHRGVDLLPATFDARVQWPKCNSIKLIRDQGQCGTCWVKDLRYFLSNQVEFTRICILVFNLGCFIVQRSVRSHLHRFRSEDQHSDLGQPGRVVLGARSVRRR